MNYMSIDSIIEVFYHFHKMLIATKHITEVFYHLNSILIATKHIADNNFVFQ